VTIRFFVEGGVRQGQISDAHGHATGPVVQLEEADDPDVIRFGDSELQHAVGEEWVGEMEDVVDSVSRATTLR
jgi:hypothetical protein